MKLKIGLLREEKMPADKRAAFTPAQCVELKSRYPGIELFMQPSEDRCFADELYRKVGLTISEDISFCDYLMGIKEVPPDKLIPGKKYLFFSHTIKKQPHNKPMMQALIRKKITLVDYETLRWKNGDRIIGFGRYAGIVGAYNGLLTWGRKFRAFDLKPAYLCHDYAEMKQE
jgi:saccharopine dehydrogenase (NAD+, L-lysine-forming)